jgi:hypothetical protein
MTNIITPFRIKVSEYNTLDIQNLAASTAIALSNITGLSIYLANLTSNNMTTTNFNAGAGNFTNLTVTNLNATNVTGAGSGSQLTTTTIFGATATASANQVIGGIFVFTGGVAMNITVPLGTALYSAMNSPPIGTTIQVFCINTGNANQATILGNTGMTIFASSNQIAFGTQRVIKFQVVSANNFNVYM